MGPVRKGVGASVGWSVDVRGPLVDRVRAEQVLGANDTIVLHLLLAQRICDVKRLRETAELPHGLLLHVAVFAPGGLGGTLVERFDIES